MGLGPSFSLEGLPGLKSVREDVRAFKGLGGQVGLRRQDTFQALHNMIPCDAYCKGTKNIKEAEAEAIDFKNLEAEAEAEVVDFGSLEAEAEVDAVDFENLEAEAETEVVKVTASTHSGQK